MATSPPWPADGNSIWLPASAQQHYKLLRARGLGEGTPFYPTHPFLSLRKKLSVTCAAEGTWEVCLRLLLREGTCQKSKRPPSSTPTRSDSWAQEEETQHEWAEYSTGAVQKSVQATFFRVLGQTGTSSSKPASQLSRGAHLSETLVIVSRSVGLQDALWILLHQGAPSHFSCQQQILTVHRVQVLHLQVERARNRG